MSGTDVTQHLSDVYDSREAVDNTETFEYLVGLREQAWAMVSEGLPLREDLTCADIRDIPALDGSIVGNMHTYTGDGSPVDWIVRSWVGRPETGFTNIHLTCWLDAAVTVPHLGFALGTAPDVFFYVDLLPRYELIQHPAHLRRYFEQFNQRWIEYRRDPEIAVFNPVHAFTRTNLSPICLVGLVPVEVFRRKVADLMLEYVAAWVELVQQAESSPEADRPAIAARDQLIRRNIVEEDPANVMADRMVGVLVRERLVRILWAAERDTN